MREYSKSSHNHRRAFTLVEMLLVLTIIGLLSLMAAIRMGGTTRRAHLEWAIQRFLMCENAVRGDAARNGRAGRIEFELGTGRVRRSLGTRGDSGTEIDLGTILVTEFQGETGTVRSGRVAVDYSPDGASRTFALELSVSGIGTARRAPMCWLLVAGLTGHVTRLESEDDVKRYLEAVRPAGAHAD